ncbi:hypothetical protein HPB52_018001 [Rhipicephalus sanguineus]|uniref:Uncharacterized protein n=1 Tax=Rhipicephalus sanguineus TaxID=34632 RepID=A0A9D4PX93_RHISA|nr:hypothetical protein HPB52_018001 [Rhipicephalus sanguineus]
MPFTNRTVRERTYRLLERFAARDRVAIRSSGTEEEYGEREALLQEILDLARESGVTIRAPRRANMPSEAVAGPVPEQLPFAFAPQLVFEVVEIAASYQQSSFLIA